MSQPLVVDIPHHLGAAEAKRRIRANIGTLGSKLPAGATVQPVWEGERLRLDVAMLSQQVTAWLDVAETAIRITVQLPPTLAFFGDAVKAALRQGGSALLEDRTTR